MRRHLLRMAVPAVLAGTVLLGCSRKSPAPPDPGPSRAAAFTVHTPCVISGPIQKVVIAYEESHPGAKIDTATDKPLAMLGAVKGEKAEPGVVLTLGEVEMDDLISAGAVDPAQVVPVARNAYQLAVIVPAENEALEHLSDLAGPKAKRVAIEDPKLSTLGNRTEQALRKLGLWGKIAPKVVRFDPTKNVLSELLAGKADAAFVYQDCLFAEGGSPPRTVRLLATLPSDSYAPITYRAAPLKRTGQSPQAADFVKWLISAEGKKALQKAGLSPP